MVSCGVVWCRGILCRVVTWCGMACHAMSCHTHTYYIYIYVTIIISIVYVYIYICAYMIVCVHDVCVRLFFVFDSLIVCLFVACL